MVYLEEKVIWDELNAHAEKHGLKPSNLIRMATRQLIEKLSNPNARLVFQIYDDSNN